LLVAKCGQSAPVGSDGAHVPAFGDSREAVTEREVFTSLMGGGF